MKKKTEKNKSGFFIPVSKFFLLTIVFLRPFFDGFSSPTFNLISNLCFFVLALLSVLILYKKIEFSTAQITFLTFVLFCLFFAPFWSLWYRTLKEFTYLLSLFCIWMLFKTMFKDEDFQLIAQILIFSLFLIILYGIHQYFWGLENTRKMLMQNPELIKSISQTYLDRMASNRIFATFVYPNTFAGYLLMLYPVVFFSIFCEKQKVAFRIINAVILSTVLPVFALTESMGGWFCFLIISFLMLLFFIIPRKFYLYVCFALFLLIIFAVISGVKTGSLPKISSLTDRINYWIAAFEIFKNHPLTGVGPGNFSFFYLQFKLPGSMEAKFAHNLFFEVLTCTGLIGCIIFFASIFFFLQKNARKVLSLENYFLSGFFFAVAGIFLHCLVDFDYADAAITTILFSFTGLIECCFSSEKRRQMRLTKLLFGIIIILIPLATIVEFKSWRVEKIIENIKNQTVKENPIQVLERASSIFPEPEIFFMQGEIFRYIYNQTKDTDFAEKAINALKKAIELNNLVPGYHRMLAKMYIDIGEYDKAEEQLLKVVELYPTKSVYNMELGLFYKKMGKDDLARIYLKKSQQLPPSNKDEEKMLEEYKNGKNF